MRKMQKRLRFLLKISKDSQKKGYLWEQMNSTSFTVRITLRRFCLRAKMKTLKSTLSISLQSFNITNHFNHAGNKVYRVRLFKTLFRGIKRS